MPTQILANLLNGDLLGAIVFYIVINPQSWATDSFHAKTLAGGGRALTPARQ
jgi:hypothetical protein